MSAEENKAVSRRVAEEVFNGHNADLADELYAPDYVLHDPSLPEDLHGPEGIKRYATMTLGAFPDIRVAVEDQVAEGDKVVSRWTATGTHTGDLMGIPPTGRRVEISGVTINRFSGGRSPRTGTRATTSGCSSSALYPRVSSRGTPTPPSEPTWAPSGPGRRKRCRTTLATRPRAALLNWR